MATKTTFRHIGYYNDHEDIVSLFGRSADYIVKIMLDGLGAFHKTEGNCDTDIDDYNDEHDANMFQLTTDKKYLVRFERGGNNADGWYIDIYKETEVEINKNDGKIHEFCSICGDEVMLDNVFKLQRCPNCGRPIVPCSICPYDDCTSQCMLSKKSDRLNKAFDESLIEVTTSSFIERFKALEFVKQCLGYTIYFYQNFYETRLKFYFDFRNKNYLLTKDNFDGQAYTWKDIPTPERFFDGLLSVSGEELDCFKIKANF
jgi:predicted RNA-binding Zn-ribbon protein involved in translation (DUF1610 family)